MYSFVLGCFGHKIRAYPQYIEWGMAKKTAHPIPLKTGSLSFPASDNYLYTRPKFRRAEPSISGLRKFFTEGD